MNIVGPSHGAGAGGMGASGAATGPVDLVHVYVESRQMLDITGEQEEAVVAGSSKTKQSESVKRLRSDRLSRPDSGSPHARRPLPKASVGQDAVSISSAAAESISSRTHSSGGPSQGASEATLALMHVYSDAEQSGASLFLLGPAFHFSAAELTQLPPAQRFVSHISNATSCS